MSIQQSLERWIINNPKQVILVIIVLIITIVFAVFGLILALIVVWVLAKKGNDDTKKIIETKEAITEPIKQESLLLEKDIKKEEKRIEEQRKKIGVTKVTNFDNIISNKENLLQGNTFKLTFDTNKKPITLYWSYWTSNTYDVQDDGDGYYIIYNGNKYFIYEKGKIWYFIDLINSKYAPINT